MDWSWSLNPLTTPEALNKREAWENAGPNDYQQPDRQVLAFIQEIRMLRDALNTSTRPLVFSGPTKAATMRQIRKAAARQSD